MALAGFAYFKNSFEVHFLCVRDIVRQFDLFTFAAIKLFQNLMRLTNLYTSFTSFEQQATKNKFFHQSMQASY